MPGPKTPPVTPGPGKPPTPGSPSPTPSQPPGTTPGGTPGFPQPGAPSAPGAPAAKKDDQKWPKEINGKSAEVIVKEMRTASDPAVREAAVRTLPLFGPKGREFGASELVEAMTRDSDWNVRLAAIEMAPTVLFAYATGPDVPLSNGVNGIMSLLNSEHMPARFASIAAAGAIGPYMRHATSGKVVATLTSRAKEGGSWQMRRAAAAALGAVGIGALKLETPDPADRESPDQLAVNALLDILKQDNCAVVRREAVNSLIAVGVVSAAQQKKWRADLDTVLGREKDKSVLLWTRTCILANDPNGLKGNELILDAIARVLQAPEPAGRVEACQAIALLGEKITVGKLDDLLNLINNPKEEPIVVAAAIGAVSTMKSQAKITLPLMDQLKLTHPNEDVRKIAAEASDILAGRKKG
jgi:HEAT repeat protein